MPEVRTQLATCEKSNQYLIMEDLPFAKDLPFFKTSQSDPEKWLDKTEKLIESIGGRVDTRVTARANGKQGILIGFIIEGDYYKLTYPVLAVKDEKNGYAALRQCATLIYHDVKSRVNRIRIFHPRVVFADFLVLRDGSTLAESATTDIPDLLTSAKIKQ